MPDPALSIAVPLIAEFEGFRPAPYQDCGAGVWTIGYGFTILPDGSRVTAHTPHMTEPQARGILTTLVAKTLALVTDMIDRPVGDNARAACASFAYNEGTGRFRSSTILQHINTGDTLNAARYFGGYCYAGGKQIPGLVRRRAAEAELFVTPDLVAKGDTGIPVTEQHQQVPSVREVTADELMNRYNPGVPK